MWAKAASRSSSCQTAFCFGPTNGYSSKIDNNLRTKKDVNAEMWLANAARNTDTENIKKRVDVVALLLIWWASGTTSAATSGAGIIVVATQLLRVRQRWRRRDQVCSPTKRRPSSRNQIRRCRSASNCCALSPEVAQLNQNGKNVNWSDQRSSL